MIRLNDNSTPVLILRSDSHGGLNIMRSLGPLGIDVYNLDPSVIAPANFSRYCRGRYVWDIEHAPDRPSLAYLAEVRRKIGRPSILIPTTDTDGAFRRPLERGRSATCSFFPSSPWAWSMHSPANRGCTAWRSGTAFPRQNAPSRLLAPRLLIS